VERDAARAALTRAARAVADLARAAPDPERPVAGSDWSVREVIAHLVLIIEGFCRYATGDATPVIDLADLARSNPAAIEKVEERDVRALADRLEAGVAEFLELIVDRALDDPMVWHGVDTTVGAACGIYLGELLMHGEDIARTIEAPWPIAREDATIVLEGTSQTAHHFLDPTPRPDAAFEVRLRGGPRFVYRFAGDSMRMERGGARDVDCRISADPVAMMHVVYGRRGQWPEILRGRLLAFGRRPWLAMSFGDRFSGF
jgi:uncharacterized protein (TIGR03083 family)